MEDEIRLLALENAVKFQGRANPGAVLGAILGKNIALKNEVKTIMPQVKAIVQEINKLSFEEQKKALATLDPHALDKKKKKKRELPELTNTEHGVTTRLPPEPSKYPHIGHAFSFLINYLYAQKYEGECVLRFDDTNPKKAELQYYDAFRDALKWLGIHVDREMILSSHMQDFYSYAKEMIEKERAFVCFCDKETVGAYREKAMICDHRKQSARKNLTFWQEMLDKKYKEGECILRLTGEIDSANAVMRDPILFRIVDYPHPLTKEKYSVWPMYDFATVVAEKLSGVSHILRSNEFGSMRIELQNYIREILDFPKQTVRQYGRFSIKGSTTKGREIRAMIEKGDVSGWDDPRLVTIQAIRRRGFLPETLKHVALEGGLSRTETNVDWSVLAAFNRKLIDDTTKRYFFVKDAQKVLVSHALSSVSVPLHPTNERLGKKKMDLSQEFYVEDVLVAGVVYRFMHIFNFVDKKFVSQDYDSSLGAKIIHAVPVQDAVDVTVLMNDGTLISGKGEKALLDLKEGEVVQFERKFFCRLDDKKKMLFVYTHD